MLFQIYYYRWTNPALSEAPLLVTEDVSPPETFEETPLLSTSGAERGKRTIIHEFGKYAGALLFVFAVGVAAWAVDESIHGGQPRSQPEEVFEWRSQVLGWISAVMYCKFGWCLCGETIAHMHMHDAVGARVPQIGGLSARFVCHLALTAREQLKISRHGVRVSRHFYSCTPYAGT